MKEDEIIANLSHSYFNHILKEVKPFLEYFENLNVSSTTNTDLNFSAEKEPINSDVLERLFFMATILSVDLHLPFNYDIKHILNNGSIKTLKKYEWLTDIKPFGSRSKQGVVTKSLIFDKFHIVIKRSKSSKFDEITYRDFCVGINLNKILNEAPFFVRTLGCFQHKNQFHIATEFIDGINLKDFIQSKKNNFSHFLNIFFQILLGLEVAQNKLNFAHYDLHTDNIILVPQNNTFEVFLHGYNYIIKNNYKPVMIDFGLSSVHSKNQTLGQKSLESKGIYNHLSPGYDIYVFLLFCLDVAQSSNISIYKGITDLLLFFKLETALSMELLTNNHIKCLKKGVDRCIPNQFVQYLIQNYSQYLNVEVQPKKYDKCLGQKPMFLKLKEIFDRSDELSISRNFNHNLGFIKTLIENIKIYYWYKEKVNLTNLKIKELLETDRINLQNLIDDLNLNMDKITIEQKNLFFVALDYYYLILELELHLQYPFYKQWSNDFKNTFVYKHIFKQLDSILYEERVKRISF
jgi:hypothetical protein